MKRVTIIAGLPGSGKSTYMGKYIKEKGGFWYIVDDYNSSMLEFTKERIHEKQNIIISSIDFCKKATLVEFKEMLETEFKDLDIDIIYFENNPHKCIENLIERSRNRGDYFKVTNIGSTQMIGEVNPSTGKAGFESDIKSVIELWRNYYIDVTKTIVPVYSKSH
mgnify:CR=1 FL=1